MVYNFKYVYNTTPYTISVVNTENHGDDYTVGPKSTAAHDAWLCTNENGVKGVSLFCNLPGGGEKLLLHMWDHDWRVKFRVANETKVHAYDPHAWGSMDFWIDLYTDRIEFRRNISGNHQTVYTVNNWMASVEGFTTD